MRSVILLTSLVFLQARASLLTVGCNEIKTFVDTHNDLRQKVMSGKVTGQPAAAMMNLLVWDEELANKASEWAAKHLKTHNPSKTVGSKRFSTGENLYWCSTNNINKKLTVSDLAKRAANSWGGEHTNYTYKIISKSDFNKNKQKTGHYTQMDWSSTNYIGCAVSQTVKLKKNEYIVVCNYGPAGNVIGQFPYKKGNGTAKLTCGNKSCLKKYGTKC